MYSKNKLRSARFHPYLSKKTHKHLLELFLTAASTSKKSSIVENYHKTEAEKARLASLLANLSLFANAIFDVLYEAAGFMYLQHLTPNTKVFLPSNEASLCIVNSGEFVSSEDETKIFTRDSIFGEQSFHNDSQQHQPEQQPTLICQKEGNVWILDANIFNTIQKAMANHLKNFKNLLIQELPAIKILPEAVVEELVTLFSFVVYNHNETITDNWCEDSRFFFLLSGRVRITVKNEADGTENDMAVLESGACFGAWAPKSDRSLATAVYAQGTVCCAVLSAEEFSNFVSGVDESAVDSTISDLKMLAVSPIK